MKDLAETIQKKQKKIEAVKRKISCLENDIDTAKRTIQTYKSDISDLQSNLENLENLNKINILQNIRKSPDLWTKYYEAYVNYDFSTEKSYLRNWGKFTDEDLKFANEYYHLTKEEFGCIIDICLEHPLLQVKSDWGVKVENTKGKNTPSNNGDIPVSYALKFAFTFLKYQDYIDFQKKISQTIADICTVGCHSNVYELTIYLHREGPPLGEKEIQQFRKMVRTYQKIQ